MNYLKLAQSLFDLCHKLAHKAHVEARKSIDNIENEISGLNMQKAAHLVVEARAINFKAKLEEFLNV